MLRSWLGEAPVDYIRFEQAISYGKYAFQFADGFDNLEEFIFAVEHCVSEDKSDLAYGRLQSRRFY